MTSCIQALITIFHIFQSASLLRDRCPNARLKFVFVNNTAYPGPEYGPFADMDNKKEIYLKHQTEVIEEWKKELNDVENGTKFKVKILK